MAKKLVVVGVVFVVDEVVVVVVGEVVVVVVDEVVRVVVVVDEVVVLFECFSSGAFAGSAVWRRQSIPNISL